MINTGILRTTENASSTQNLLKSEQKLPRLKAKALGDVQNTLHSRPGNYTNANTNSAVKAPGKSQSHVKSTAYENYLSNSATRKIVNVTESKTLVKSPLTIPVDDDDVFETHQHMLYCEEDQQSYLNDYFSEFKFSEENINNLVRSVKTSVDLISVPLYEPCEDIELPNFKKNYCDFSISDILSDLIIPGVPPV